MPSKQVRLITSFSTFGLGGSLAFPMQFVHQKIVEDRKLVSAQEDKVVNSTASPCRCLCRQRSYIVGSERFLELWQTQQFGETAVWVSSETDHLRRRL